MDQYFKDLIEASSLETPAARRIRSSTTSEVIDDVRHRIQDPRQPCSRRGDQRTPAGNTPP